MFLKMWGLSYSENKSAVTDGTEVGTVEEVDVIHAFKCAERQFGVVLALVAMPFIFNTAFARAISTALCRVSTLSDPDTDFIRHRICASQCTDDAHRLQNIAFGMSLERCRAMKLILVATSGQSEHNMHL